MLSYACMSSSLPRQVKWILFVHTHHISISFPRVNGGSAPALGVSGPAQRSPNYNLHARGAAETALFTEGPDDFVTSIATSIATGWNETVPRWGYLPLKSTDSHGARLPIPYRGL